MPRIRREVGMSLIKRWLISTLSIYGVAWLLNPYVRVDDFASAIWAGLALGLINAVVRPLIVLLTLPVTVLSLGLFLLVINGALLLWVDRLVAGFQIASFGWAILASLLISLAGTLLHSLVKD